MEIVILLVLVGISLWALRYKPQLAELMGYGVIALIAASGVMLMFEGYAIGGIATILGVGGLFAIAGIARYNGSDKWERLRARGRNIAKQR